jgi:hypothetical protein
MVTQRLGKKKGRLAGGLSRESGTLHYAGARIPRLSRYSMAFAMSSITFFASPNTIMVFSR